MAMFLMLPSQRAHFGGETISLYITSTSDSYHDLSTMESQSYFGKIIWMTIREDDYPHLFPLQMIESYPRKGIECNKQ
jgi:hypothetical protein